MKLSKAEAKILYSIMVEQHALTLDPNGEHGTPREVNIALDHLRSLILSFADDSEEGE